MSDNEVPYEAPTPFIDIERGFYDPTGQTPNLPLTPNRRFWLEAGFDLNAAIEQNPQDPSLRESMEIVTDAISRINVRALYGGQGLASRTMDESEFSVPRTPHNDEDLIAEANGDQKYLDRLVGVRIAERMVAESPDDEGLRATLNAMQEALDTYRNPHS